MNINYTKLNKHNNKIVPARIKEARISRGLSLSQLSEFIGVSSQAISQYELGTSRPSATVLMKLIEILGFPLNYFKKPKGIFCKDCSNSATYFRSMKSTPKKLKYAYEIRIDWIDEIYQFLNQYINFPEINIPEFKDLLNDRLDYETIEEIALSLRKYWGIEKAPIINLSELLEKNGFVIGNINFSNKKIDAFSRWFNNVPYIVLETDNSSAVRNRFDLAHELGHLILHQNIDEDSIRNKNVLDKIEDEANCFAGAFLLPNNSFAEEVMSTSLEHFVILKKRWKVSIQAMIKRCENLNLLTESQVRYLFMQISKKGLRRKEPLDDTLQFENPYLIKQAIKLLIENEVLSPDDIVEEISLNKDEIDCMCFLPKDMLRAKKLTPELTLIKNM